MSLEIKKYIHLKILKSIKPLQLLLLLVTLLISICGHTQESIKESIEAEIRVTIEDKAVLLHQAYYIPSLSDSVTIHKLQFYIGSGDSPAYTQVDLADSTSTYMRLPYPQDKMLEIILGVDSLTNVSGVQGGALDPMHGLYWTWNSGYINFKLEGTSPICSTRKNKFQLHLGGFMAPYNAMRVIQHPLESEAGQLIIELELDQFLNQINLRENPTIMRPSKEAMQASDILKKSFSIK